jgi:tetratricopeptide (TPR) repeat protein
VPHHARRTLPAGPLRGALTLGLIALTSAIASAQRSPAPDDRSARVADVIEQVALLDLRMQQNPLPLDYQLAYHLISVAAALEPENLDRQHTLAAAAWASTDERLLRQATERIVRLDPKDTVAQLRLISDRIGDLQTGEERLAAYERYLGPRGEAIDPSVRSRLAVDAANLARELGDERRFVELLSMATSLDITNKLAATLAMAYHAERRDDPVERLEMLVNLLYADPLDSNIHQAIAQLLASEGAFEQARRYFSNAALIHQHAGDANLSLLQQGLLYQWHDEGPESVVKTLNDMIARRRQSIAESRAMAEAAGESTVDMPRPEDERLDPSIDRIRVLAASAAGDKDSMLAALRDMSEQTTEQVRQMSAYLAGNDEQLRARAMMQMAQLFGELHFTAVLADAEPETSARAVQVFASQAPDLNRLIRWLIPWITLRLEDHEAAAKVRDFLETGLGRDLFDAEMALAKGERSTAARLYLSVMRESPISPLGAWAGTRLKTLVGTDDIRTREGKQLDAFARSIPPVIDKMLEGPSEFMNLRFEPMQRTLTAGEPAMARVVIQNTSTIPLALGPMGPISSRFLIQPHIDTEIGVFEAEPQPEVLELDRRLRLMPRESVEAIVRVDSPFTRWLLGLNADSTMRQSWRLLQGFRAAREGGAMAKGPLCHSAETRPMLIRFPASATPPSAEELARRLRTVPVGDLPNILSAARAALLKDTAQTADTSPLADLAEAAVERYDRADSLDRALMLGVLPHAKMNPVMERFDARARELVSAQIRSGDPIDQIVASLVLITRTQGVGDELLTECSGAPEAEMVQTIAVLLRRRFNVGGVGYAQASASPEALVGPTLSLLRSQADEAAKLRAAEEAAKNQRPAPPGAGG